MKMSPTTMRNTLLAGTAALGLVALGAFAALGAREHLQAQGVATEPEPVAAVVSKAEPAPARPKPAAASARCSTCGVVEAVTPITVKGEGTGLGAAAGGILGGVIGHQMGGGSGKDAMTVIGAVGGGVAGHEIEKRQRATTTYQVRVRMADGSLRTVTQPQSLAVGAAVRLEGEPLRAVVRQG